MHAQIEKINLVQVNTEPLRNQKQEMKGDEPTQTTAQAQVNLTLCHTHTKHTHKLHAPVFLQAGQLH